MQTLAKHYWAKATAATLAGFVVGMAGYIAVGILSARGEPNASGVGGWQQVSVTPQLDDMVLEYALETPLVGNGTASSPHITYNSGITIRLAMVGSGVLTIDDKYNNRLYEYEKTLDGISVFSSATYEKLTADIELVGGIGRHELTVRLDGAPALGPNVAETLHIDYRAVPIAPEEAGIPEVPNTGSLRHLYVAGYAVPTYGIIWSGLILAALVLGAFVIVALRQQKKQKSQAQKNLATRKKINREISGRTLTKTTDT